MAPLILLGFGRGRAFESTLWEGLLTRIWEEWDDGGGEATDMSLVEVARIGSFFFPFSAFFLMDANSLSDRSSLNDHLVFARNRLVVRVSSVQVPS